MEDLRLWHYTTAERIDEIIESGEIRTSKHNATSRKEKPTVWVSSNPLWERTATKMIIDEMGNRKTLSMAEQHELIGLGRIEVYNDTPDLFTWHRFKNYIAPKKHIAREMEAVGIKKGANPSEWYGSHEPIARLDWIKAEIWDGKQWQVHTIFDQE